MITPPDFSPPDSSPPDFRELNCAQCRHGEALGFDFSMALQPIVDVTSGQIYAYEALARGLGGEPAGHVFQSVNDSNLYRFDQACRVKAIELAARLQVPTYLTINFMPNAVYRPELCIRTTLAAASACNFPAERIIFEFTEGETVQDHSHLRNIVEHYQACGFKTAIDDFGAGYSGLNLLAELQTDFIKIDMALIRGIDSHPVRRAIVGRVIDLCADLGIVLIAEGIETRAEYKTLHEMGINLFQGYHFGRPQFEALSVLDADVLRLDL